MNALVSALVFKSDSSAWMRQAWQSSIITPLVSQYTRDELIRVLSYPKLRLPAEAREIPLDDYLPWCETVVMPDPPPAVPDCRDPSDKPFLELTLAGQTDALVTGDADLLWR